MAVPCRRDSVRIFQRDSGAHRITSMYPVVYDSIVQSGWQVLHKIRQQEDDQIQAVSGLVVLMGLVRPSVGLLHCVLCILDTQDSPFLAARALTQWTSSAPNELSQEVLKFCSSHGDSLEEARCILNNIFSWLECASSCGGANGVSELCGEECPLWSTLETWASNHGLLELYAKIEQQRSKIAPMLRT